MKIISECKLISLDTSTSSTGYAVYISGKLHRYDLIDFKRIKNTDERIKEMILKIYEIIETEKPQIIVAEMTVVTRNAQAQRNLTMILGAIQGKCLENNIPLIDIFWSRDNLVFVFDKKASKNAYDLWCKHELN